MGLFKQFVKVLGLEIQISFTKKMETSVSSALGIIIMILSETMMTTDAFSVTQTGHRQPSGEVKEYHFHVYWFTLNNDHIKQARALREKIIAEVKAGNVTVVCNGVTRDILPKLDDTKVPDFNIGPIQVHPCGSFEVWTPQEFLPQMLSFFMLNRGDLSILLHPLGGPIGMSSYQEHTDNAMWLGPSFRINTDVLSKTVGDRFQYLELKLGYNAER